MGYESGDKVLVEATVKESDASGVLLEIEGRTKWVHVDSVRPCDDVTDTPEPVGRPEGEPPCQSYSPYEINQCYIVWLDDYNKILRWKIGHERLAIQVKEFGDAMIVVLITSLPEGYAEAVHAILGADAELKFGYGAYIMAPDESKVYYVIDRDGKDGTYLVEDYLHGKPNDDYMTITAAEIDDYQVIDLEKARAMWEAERAYEALDESEAEEVPAKKSAMLSLDQARAMFDAMDTARLLDAEKKDAEPADE